ncbi:MAG: MBOAT family protein, partial [Erysipelotrichaceae bacterium]
MSSYFSLVYIFAFLPIVVGLYHVCIKKYRWVVLLVASLVFYYLISNWLIIYIAFSTLSIYFLARLINNYHQKISDDSVNKKSYQKKQKLLIVLGVLLNIGILVILK